MLPPEDCKECHAGFDPAKWTTLHHSWCSVAKYTKLRDLAMAGDDDAASQLGMLVLAKALGCDGQGD